MGCDPVIFAGADLAYSGGRPYARGVTYEEDWRRRSEWGEPLDRQWAQALDMHPHVVEQDVAGNPVRTAPHLVAFRDWLADQVARDTGRRFFNATGAGIFRGSNIEQIQPDGVQELLQGRNSVAADLALKRHRTPATSRVLDSARMLVRAARAAGDAGHQVIDQWQQFAPTLSRAAILEALESGVGGHLKRTVSSVPPAHARVAISEQSLRTWIDNVPLVPFAIAPYRLDRAPTGARAFRYRTMAARLICCALQPPDGGVLEDGRPLRQVWDLADVVDGTYSICRDEIQFRSTDGSDPRWNGRQYTVLVPPCVAELEQLPLDEILKRHV
jgi:hypothetical protein